LAFTSAGSLTLHCCLHATMHPIHPIHLSRLHKTILPLCLSIGSFSRTVQRKKNAIGVRRSGGDRRSIHARSIRSELAGSSWPPIFFFCLIRKCSSNYLPLNEYIVLGTYDMGIMTLHACMQPCGVVVAPARPARSKDSQYLSLFSYFF
jgi:hypothetical protein